MPPRLQPMPWTEYCDTDATSEAPAVETLSLRKGVCLILSRFDAQRTCHFHHVETENVFGIGFHLRGGACFDLESQCFRTRPLNVWAAAAPRGSTSRFVLPEQGFRTVSLRFTPEAVDEFLQAHRPRDWPATDLMQIAQIAPYDVAATRLAPLNPIATRIVESMFTTPYAGQSRRLHLESCALGLMAAQLDAAQRCEHGIPGSSSEQRRMLHARDILDHRLTDPPTIYELARIIGTNDFKLKRDFKQTFGTTIFGYVRQRRMERALTDLHAGRLVGEVARRVGYECPRCFADAFRRHFGILPSEITGRNSRLPRHSLPRTADA